jgi:hypothetical protein
MSVSAALKDFADLITCQMLAGGYVAGPEWQAWCGTGIDEILVPAQEAEKSFRRKYGREPAEYKPRWPIELQKHPRLSDKEWWPLRNGILERDGFVCAYCKETDGPWCADHIVPLSRGGSNEPDNLVACCGPCNASKSDRLLSEWRGRGR